MVSAAISTLETCSPLETRLIWQEKALFAQPQQSSLGQLGRDLARAEITQRTNLTFGRCICEAKLCSGNQPQPQGIFAQESNACLVLTWPYAPHRAKEGLGCLWLRGSCCFGEWSPWTETHSKRVLLREEGCTGRKSPCLHSPQQPTFSHLGRDPGRADLRKGTELASGSCILRT